VWTGDEICVRLIHLAQDEGQLRVFVNMLSSCSMEGGGDA
jgi:hypothetical protein